MTAKKELVVIARFRDLVTKEIKRMGTGFTKFSRSAIKAVKKVNDSVLKLTVGLNQGLALVGKMGRAFQAMSRLIAIPVRLAIEQERVEAQLTQVIKSTGGAAGLAATQLRDMAAAMQQLTIFGDEAVIGAQNILLTFTNIGGAGGIFERSTEAILNVATAMQLDLKSAAIQVGKALNDPTTGLSMLTRVGITFSETQKDLIKDLQAMGKTAEAQTVILDELERQFGGSAKAARETFGGALIALNNDFGDLLEEMGSFVTSNKDLIVIVDKVSKAFEGWSEQVRELVDTKDGQREFAEVVKKFIVGFLRGIQGVISIIPVMVEGIVLVVEALREAAIAAKDFFDFLPRQLRNTGESFDRLLEKVDAFTRAEFGVSIGISGGKVIVNELSSSQSAMDALRVASGKLNEGLEDVAQTVEDIDFVLEEHRRNTKSLSDIYADFTGVVDTLREAMAKTRAEMDLANELAATGAKRYSEQREEILNLLGGFGEATGAMNAWNAEWQKLRISMIGLPWDEQIALMAEFSDSLEQQVKLAEGFKAPDFQPEKTQDAAGAYKALMESAQGAWEWVSKFFEPRGEAVNPITAGFSDGISNALTQLQDFRTEAERATTDLLQGTQRGLVDFFRSLRDGTESLRGAFGNLLDTVKQKMSDLLLEFAANRALQGILEGFQSLTGIGAGEKPEDANNAALSANTVAILSLKASIEGGGALGLIGGGGVSTDAIEGLDDTLSAGQEESAGLMAAIGSGISGLGAVFVNVGNFLFQGLLSIVSAIGTLIASGSFGDAFGSFVGFSGGGPVNYLAGGGMPAFDPRGTDTVPAMLTPGEFVLQRSAVQAIGIGRLKRANQAQGFADGGLVGSGGGGGAAPAVNIGITINAVDARGVRDMLQTRDGQEAIIGVVRRGISRMPQFQNQISRLGKK